MRKREEVKIDGSETFLLFFNLRGFSLPLSPSPLPPDPSPSAQKTRNQKSSAFPITPIDMVERSTDKQLCNGV